MSFPKRSLILAGALCVLGAVLRVLGVSWGLEVLVLGVFVAVVSMTFIQRAVQREVATLRRNSTRRLQGLATEQAALVASMEEQSKLLRTTLYYAKNGSVSALGAIGGDPAPTSSGLADLTRRQGIAGRSSTPEVTNNRARHSFAAILGDAAEAPTIAGVLTPGAVDSLPAGARFTPFLPFRAAEAVTADGPLDLLIIDESAFRSVPWDRAVGPVGVGMMQDLELALRQAIEQDVQLVILQDDLVPDVHTAALAGLRALRLPMSNADREAAADAPASPVVAALSRFAEDRRAA